MPNLFVKICGITTAADAQLAASLGANAIGFVFHCASPRAIDPETAGAISRALPPAIQRVGVFVNASAREITTVVQQAELDSVQLHGDETASFADGLRIPYIKALRLQTAEDLQAATYFLQAQALLVDAFVPQQRGGTGHLANWTLAASAKKLGNVILAGGISPENVGRALHTVRPFGIDASSGLESAPGKKDEARLRAFFAEVKLHA